MWKNKHVHRKFLFGLFFLVVFFLGFFSGTTFSIKKSILNDDGEVEITKVMDLYSKTRSEEVSFDQFWKLWDKIHEKYVIQPVDDVELFYGAMQGLVAGIGDQHSVFFPPEIAKQFAEDLSGKFGGIGAEIGEKNDRLVVIAPLAGSPSEKAGMRIGDMIFTIDGEETLGLTVGEAVEKIRGEKGTQVVLGVSKNEGSPIKEISITRADIDVPTVTLEFFDGNIAFLKIAYFNGNTVKQFNEKVLEIEKKNPKGIVLDMRSNPGGYLDAAIAVASEWIPDGEVLKEKFRDGETRVYRSSGSHKLSGIPTVILVDEGTASGSEIVAGALQDYQIAKLIGKKTYGKGSVQDFEVFDDGSALKLTVALWYTPADRVINEKGIEPDIEIEKMFVEKPGIEEGKGETRDDFVDMGLKKGIEILKGKL